MANPLFEPRDWRALGGTARWRIGPHTAFGKGMSEDKDGNKLWHLLEIDRLDHSFKYGAVDLYTEYEKQFEDIYKDVAGNPDYIGNLDKIDDFVCQIKAEPLYAYADDGITALKSFTTKFGPIISDGGVHGISLYVVSAAGTSKGAITSAKYSLTNYDILAKDRLADLTNVLKSNEITITDYSEITGGDIAEGDVVFIDYYYFHHTDMLRDHKSYTLFSSPKGKTNITITADISPTGSTLAQPAVNNVELSSPSFPVPLGAEEYILQTGIPDAKGNVSFKVVSTGKLPLKTDGSVTVIKFDAATVKYVRLILLGSPVDSFLEVDTYIKDIVTYSYENVTIIPYYLDTTVSDIQGSLITGDMITVTEIVEFDNDAKSTVGKLYIPQYNIYDVEARQHYVLSHFDIRYGTDIIYKGIPSSFLTSSEYLLFENIGTMAVSEPFPAGNIEADIYMAFTYDLISRNADTGDQYFKTLFTNVDEVTFELYTSADNYVTPLVKDTEYTVVGVTGQISLIGGRVLEVNELLRAKYKRSVVRTTDTGHDDSLYFIASRVHTSSIMLSEMKIFPDIYFAEFVPNDETEIYEFDINPAAQSDSVVSNKQLVKLLGGVYIKQTFGNKKIRMSVSGEMITDEMCTKLKEYEQRTEPLGLVTDTFEFFKVAIVPDTLKTTRRKTTAADYDDATTTWSYSMEIQEL